MTDQLIFQIEVAGSDAAIQEAANLSNAIRANREQIRGLSQDYENNATEIQQLQNQNRRLSQEQRNLANTANAVEGSYSALSAQMAELRRRQRDINVSTADGERRYREVGQEINRLQTRLRDLDAVNGVHTRNVGNYTNSIIEASGALGGFGGQIQNTYSQFTQLSRILTILPRGLQLLKVALIGTGIGAIVVLLGSLVAYFASTQEGMDKVNMVLRPLSALFQRLIGVLQELGGKVFKQLSKAVDDPIQAFKDLGQAIIDNVINRFKAFSVFGEAISLLMKGEFKAAMKTGADAVIQLTTGITDGTDKLAAFGETVKKIAISALDAGARIDQMKKSYEQFEIDVTRRSARLKQTFEEQKALSDDVNLSIEQRLEASKKASAAYQELTNLEVGLLQKKLDIRLEEQKLNDTSRADLLENAKIEAEIFQLRATQAKRTNEVQNREIQLLKEFNKELFAKLKMTYEIENAEKESAKTKEIAAQATIKQRTEIEKLSEEEVKRLELLRKVQAVTESGAITSIESLQKIGAAFTEMLVTGELSVKNFKKIILLGLLDTLQGMIPVLVAQITGISLAQPDSVATFGASGFARAALLTGLLEGAVAGARALVNQQEFEQGGIAETGGVLKGKRHSQGGVKFSVGGKLGFEAEGGEAIINRKSTRMYRPLLSAINQAGGGKKFAQGGTLPNINSMANGIVSSNNQIRMINGFNNLVVVSHVPVASRVQKEISVRELNSTL